MKLTLRDLFWLTLVVAMGTAWGIDNAFLRSQLDGELLLRNYEMAVRIRELELKYVDEVPSGCPQGIPDFPKP